LQRLLGCELEMQLQLSKFYLRTSHERTLCHNRFFAFRAHHCAPDNYAQQAFIVVCSTQQDDCCDHVVVVTIIIVCKLRCVDSVGPLFGVGWCMFFVAHELRSQFSTSLKRSLHYYIHCTAVFRVPVFSWACWRALRVVCQRCSTFRGSAPCARFFILFTVIVFLFRFMFFVVRVVFGRPRCAAQFRRTRNNV